MDGSARITIDGTDIDTDTGVFGTMLHRAASDSGSGDAGEGRPWPVTITARFADGSVFSRRFVLDRHGGPMPGMPDADSDMDGGMSERERAEHFGEVGQTVESEIRPGAPGRVALGTDVSVELPAGAVRGRTRVSLTHLDAARLPKLDPGMVNVTAPAARGYELLPHGQRFDIPGLLDSARTHVYNFFSCGSLCVFVAERGRVTLLSDDEQEDMPATRCQLEPLLVALYDCGARYVAWLQRLAAAGRSASDLEQLRSASERARARLGEQGLLGSWSCSRHISPTLPRSIRPRYALMCRPWSHC